MNTVRWKTKNRGKLTTISKDELFTLVKIIKSLTFMSDFMPELGKVVAQINLLVPFEKCTLFHELTTGANPETLVYEFSDVCPGSLRRNFSSGVPLNLDCFLRCLHKTATFKNTFFWCGNIKEVDQDLGNILKQFGLSQGSGGGVSLYGSNEIGGVTLMQLHYSDEKFAEKHLWFMNSFVPHLHAYFTRCVENTCSSDMGHNLTLKESEVLRWVGEGKTSWEVGKILSMSERTVKFHLGHIYTKFNVNNRMQAVTMASRLKLLPQHNT